MPHALSVSVQTVEYAPKIPKGIYELTLENKGYLNDLFQYFIEMISTNHLKAIIQ